MKGDKSTSDFACSYSLSWFDKDYCMQTKMQSYNKPT